MDISRENEYLLYLAVQSVRGGRVMTLPEGQDYASLFSRAGQAGVFRAVAGGIAPQLLPDEGRRTLDGIAARELRSKTKGSTACRWTASPSARSTPARPSAKSKTSTSSSASSRRRRPTGC